MNWITMLVVSAVVVLATSATVLFGDHAESVPAGHSHHGEVFDEGPRQAARLIEGTGKVDFPVTTSKPSAQRFINQGVGQLHGFWYFEAERSFRQAAAIDPDCAMAYWGMAAANHANRKRSRGFIAQAMERLESATPREAMYIRTFYDFAASDREDKQAHDAYAAALAKIAAAHPSDLDAKAFHAVQLWKNDKYGFGSKMTDPDGVDQQLREILDIEPLHPCHHYRIHLWDKEDPARALDSAELCGPVAPGIAHMWHMPGGHVYFPLKRYNDAVWSMEAAARVDHAHMTGDYVLPDQIFNYAHNNEWLVRCLANVGRMHDAVAVARNMAEIPRHPKHNTLRSRRSATYGHLRWLQALSALEGWDEIIRVAQTPHLDPADLTPAQDDRRLYYMAVAYTRIHDSKRAYQISKELRQRLDTTLAKAHKAGFIADVGSLPEDPATDDGEPVPPEGEYAEPVPDESTDRVSQKTEEMMRQRCQRILRYVNQIRGLIAVNHGKFEAGLKLLDKYSHFDRMFVARAQFTAGLKDEAVETVEQYVKQHENEVLPLANLTEVLWHCGQRERAAETFARLRRLGCDADLDVPALARLRPIARKLGFDGDWRDASARLTTDGRPSLASLGPLTWQPPRAEAWTLPDASGRTVSLADFRGRPVVVIFYLGYGCLHCAEQLQAFAPMAREFQEAGIELVAISTDSRDKLSKAVSDYKDGGFPIPLVSDAPMRIFKNYRVYDDFEDTPLHGTFLIDGSGFIRWQDISYEPFMEPDFLLGEAKRLLGPRENGGSLARSE